MGEAAGLAAAIVWATSNIVLRGQSVRLGAVQANAWRTLFAALAFAIIFALTRPVSTLTTMPKTALAALLGGVLFGMVIGDSLQLAAMVRIGVARAMPIGSIFPFFTLLIAAVFLDEQITARTIAGTCLVIAGVILVALPRSTVDAEMQGRQSASANHWLGVAMALTAALCWSLSTSLIRVGVRDVDVITANAIRLPFSAALSFLISLRVTGLPVRKFGARSFAILFLIGVLGSGGGGFLYLTAVSLAGAAKTAVLGSAAPIFGLIAAVLVLRERPGTRAIAGTLLAMLGILLVL